MNRQLIRARFAPAYATGDAIRNINVDRANEIVRNAVVMLANTEALGHGFMSDLKTIQQVAALGNQKPHGVQGRLGHPGISENAAGTQIYAAKTFRVTDDRLLADLHLFEPAHRVPGKGDVATWLMDMAEQQPAHIALSVVMEGYLVWVLGSGDEIEADPYGYDELDKRPESATTDMPVYRAEKLWAVDAVNEGALTRGMFNANEASYYAEGIFDFLDEWRVQFNVPLSAIRQKGDQLISKYLHSRGYKEETMPRVTRNKLESGDNTQVTAPVVTPVIAPSADTDSTPVEASQAEPAVDTELDAVLARAEARVEEQEAEEQAPEQELSMPEMQAVLAEQRAQIATLNAQVEKLTKLALLHDENIARLDRNVRRIDGDAVLTMSVPRGMPAGAKLEAMASSKGISLSTPVPSEATRKSAEQALQQGINARHSKPEAPSRASRHDDEARASFAASQHRAKHDGGLSNS